MTDIKLPAGYEDWVESEYPGSDSERLRVMFDYFPGDGYGAQKKAQWFVPPTPKPTLPDVKPGAVISFKSRMGSERVAIRGNFGWRVFENGASVVYVGMNWAEPIATDADLLKDVGDEGFKLMVNPL